MGNKIYRHAERVDERFTRPQGPYECKDGESRKLRRLIMNGQLAPCYPGAEEYSPELEDCPICFLFYPRLNRSKCCSKPICTECYLQVKSMDRLVTVSNCPFCKTSNYVVEYRGAKTVAEKNLEQAEEQRVIEAKIRIHQKELSDEQQRVETVGENRLAEGLNSTATTRGNGPHFQSVNNEHLDPCEELFEHELFNEHIFEEQCCLGESSVYTRSGDEDSLEMEEAMLMKAILLSIQEQGRSNQNPSTTELAFNHTIMNRFGQGMCLGDVQGMASASGSLMENQTTSCMPEELHTRSRIIDIPQRRSGFERALTGNEAATWSNGGKLYSQMHRDSEDEICPAIPSMVPESFEEQMKLAMALSLAEARARNVFY
ncbi:hypothetical protein KP509_18G086000 [Ceratopteris richardii]|uniref:RING-type domain-containing protein n=1 Tax=Ceratopteris richardii TaxID=49495 RepID=A0A8T2SRG7_CERRI|nr:hypothetical protein KP509_18G086000 [Ceratopteris richardii]